jgi:hypothetical protein
MLRHIPLLIGEYVNFPITIDFFHNTGGMTLLKVMRADRNTNRAVALFFFLANFERKLLRI